MSFNPYVPCNCRIDGKVKWPSFKDKLEIRNGLIELKSECSNDQKLIDEFESFKICEHQQLAIEFSMSQSIMGWRKHVQVNYPNQFPNFEIFIPISNDSYNHNYKVQETINEIIKLKSLEDKRYHERLDQFIKLLEKAKELNQNVYW